MAISVTGTPINLDPLVPRQLSGGALAANSHDLLLITTGVTATTVKLPKIPAGDNAVVAVRKVDAAGTGSITVSTLDGSTIDGAASVVIAGSAKGGNIYAHDNSIGGWFTIA